MSTAQSRLVSANRWRSVWRKRDEPVTFSQAASLSHAVSSQSRVSRSWAITMIRSRPTVGISASKARPMACSEVCEPSHAPGRVSASSCFIAPPHSPPTSTTQCPDGTTAGDGRLCSKRSKRSVASIWWVRRCARATASAASSADHSASAASSASASAAVIEELQDLCTYPRAPTCSAASAASATSAASPTTFVSA